MRDSTLLKIEHIREKWKQIWPRKNLGRKGAKNRQKTKAHRLEVINGSLEVLKELLNACSGTSSPLAQVKAAAAHIP
jgi:hypothetical protein